VGAGTYEDDVRFVGARVAKQLHALAALELRGGRDVELRHREDEAEAVEARVERVELEALLLAALAHFVEAAHRVVARAVAPVHIA
jgi:hypothetical protein